MAGHLVLKKSSSGSAAHFLNGKLVLEGGELEVMLPNGTWVRGRYAWSRKEDELPTLRRPLTELPVGGISDDQETVIALPSEAIVRVPEGVDEGTAPSAEPKARPAAAVDVVSELHAPEVAEASKPLVTSFEALRAMVAQAVTAPAAQAPHRPAAGRQALPKSSSHKSPPKKTSSHKGGSSKGPQPDARAAIAAFQAQPPSEVPASPGPRTFAELQAARKS